MLSMSLGDIATAKPVILPSMTVTGNTKTPYSDATQVRRKNNSIVVS